MPIELTNIKHIYRDQLPSGHYDLILISLVHQGPEILYYMAENINKYVKGNFIWIVHYNNEQQIDENTLPPWAWLVRDTIKTKHSTRLLLMGINQALKFSLANTTSLNIMLLSSGSAFFRDFIVPSYKKVALISHEVKLDTAGKNYAHIEEIEVRHMGNCTQYLESVGSFGWQYKHGGDSDLEFHTLVKNRKFNYLRGCQWPGQIWPYEVGQMLVTDITVLDNSHLHEILRYAPEELYLSTYAYNYAKNNNIRIDFVEVITDWNNGYEINNIHYIDRLRISYEGGSAVSKVPDNIHNPVRQYLLM
jgi:hypothetical protein